jgi:Conjugative transposon, TraM
MKQMQANSPQFLRKRKFLMVLPLLVIPFVIVAFVALGGGKGKAGKQQSGAAGKGFNKNLPGAHFSRNEAVMDKMGFYKKADEDSVKLMERIKQDPYHAKAPAGHMITNIDERPAIDPHADELLQKLEVLKKVLAQPNVSPIGPTGPPEGIFGSPRLSHPMEEPRLQKLLQSMQHPDTSSVPDPQMERLNGMLDKIMRIEHPVNGSAVEKDTVAVPRLLVMPVVAVSETQGVADIDTLGESLADSAFEQGGGFYEVGGEVVSDSVAQNTIPAVVEEEATLVSGSTVMLRITAESRINGIDIPRDNLLYGVASINGDRMRIVVSSIRYGQSIYPVSLQVYDLDGLAGIHIPGVVARDVAKQSAGDGIGSMNPGSFDPSVGAQAANAGIQAAKTLLSKKIKLVQVSVKAGYQVLLKNTEASHR